MHRMSHITLSALLFPFLTHHLSSVVSHADPKKAPVTGSWAAMVAANASAANGQTIVPNTTGTDRQRDNCY